jgi:hypothetical protein
MGGEALDVTSQIHRTFHQDLLQESTVYRSLCKVIPDFLDAGAK